MKDILPEKCFYCGFLTSRLRPFGNIGLCDCKNVLSLMIRSYFLGGNGSERYLISFKISNHELKFDINHNNELYGLTIFNEGSIIETYHINKLSDVDLDFSNLDKLNEQIEILEILK